MHDEIAEAIKAYLLTRSQFAPDHHCATVALTQDIPI